MNLPIPPAVLYAGLAGVLLALIVATAQNKWQWLREVNKRHTFMQTHTDKLKH